MTATLLPNAKQQFFDTNGRPLAGGQVYFYIPNTSTLKSTWQDAGKTVLNTNPVVLDANGQAIIYGDGQYRQVVYDVHGNLIWDRLTDSPALNSELQALTAGIGGPSGSSLIGFIQDAPGAVARMVQDKLRESVSVLDFMTAQQRADVISHTGSIDVTTAVQAALNYVAGLSGGGRVYVPSGLYLVTAPLNIGANTYLYGDGWFASKFKVDHSGDFLKSTFPINSSSAANINVKDLGAYTTSGASTGGGYVDVGGTYINIENCFFQSFKWGVVLDQSELVVVDRCYLLSYSRAGVWLVNGPDHTLGANTGFTNRITITNNQFNGTGNYCILDDGGATRLIAGNNFNQGGTQIRSAGAGSLSILNNEFEGTAGYPIYFAETTASGTYVGPVVGFHIQGNSIGGGTISIYMDAAHGGDITGNVVYFYSTCAFDYDFGSNARVTNVNISGNYKALLNGSGRTVPPFFSDPSHKAFLSSTGKVDQLGMTYCNQAPSAGTVVSTPVCMEDITEGCLLRVMNADGTNVETVQASNVTGTTYTATYTSSKSSGFLIFVMREQTSGTWTPTASGSSTPGAFTTSVCAGVWEKKDSRLHFNGQITWSATTSVGQMQVQMPFKAKSNGVLPVWPVTVTGPGAIAAGVGQISLTLAAGSTTATLVYLNTGTGAFSALQCPASGSLYFAGSYET